MQLLGYQVGDVIGQGGMATVYRTEHILLKQKRALKVMSPELTNQPGFKESFIREGQFIAALKHPNIVTIYDISEHDGIYFMAMEYLQGGSLEDQLPLPLETALKVLKQIGSALYYAHQQKIIHRDIKPANILFNGQGDAVLTDFGISKLEDTDSDLTKMGYGVVGTARYMSPEQTGGEKLDQRSDLYSLALVFYEMLSGEKAIQSNTRSSIIREHAVAPPPTLPEKFSFLQAVLNKALAKTTAQRYPDLHAFVEAVVTAKIRYEARVKEKRDKRIFLIRLSTSSLLIVSAFIAFSLNREGAKEIMEKEKKEVSKVLLAPELVPAESLAIVSVPKDMPKQIMSAETVINSSSDNVNEKHQVHVEPESKSIAETQPMESHKKSEPVYKTVRVSPYLLIYDQSHTKRIGRLRQGVRVEVTSIVITEEGKSWSRIQFNDQPSYVKTSQLK